MKKCLLFKLAFMVIGFSSNAADRRNMNLDNLPVGDVEPITLSSSSGNNAVGNLPTRLQRLLDLARQSQPAAFNDVNGVYVGRCYDVDDGNVPFNSVLLITRDPGDRKGSSLPTQNIVVQGRYWGNAAADFADSKTKEEITSDALALKPNFSNIVENPLSVDFTAISSISSRLSFFKSQSYLLSLRTSNQDLVKVLPNGEIGTSVKKGDVWQACYYFIKQ